MKWFYLLIPLLPLMGALATGLWGRTLGKSLTHWLTITLVAASFVMSCMAFNWVVLEQALPTTYLIYTWADIGSVAAHVGFYIDPLTVIMMLVVTFVSLMVHIYSIGYMQNDPSYQRFFSYISLFTFAMLMLVMSDNFVQLFFAWEAVGLVSYLLIGFWFQRKSAVHANLKAFLINRVGDIGLLMALALLVADMDGLHSFAYQHVFDVMREQYDYSPAALSLTLPEMLAICLLIAAMGKSAQIPLHVWLPDSMEGPTPISALIHAATMVTAGIFLIIRAAPIFEQASMILEIIVLIGAVTALLMGLVGIVQNDIKRVIAYSTLSQLGYMMAALGASMYSAALFHLVTHAFFKALLFLAAGSVIVAMHHEQDMRKMGGLRRYMPITYVTCLIGALALIGIPPFSGFFSKDLILNAVGSMQGVVGTISYIMLLLGVFVTAFYTFRMFFLVFHGDERMEDDLLHHLKESPKSITTPLILLAIPAVFSGFLLEPLGLWGAFKEGLATTWGVIQDGVIKAGVESVFSYEVKLADGTQQLTEGMALAQQPVFAQLVHGYHGLLDFVLHGFLSLPVWLAIAGVACAWYLYLKNDDLLDALEDRLQGVRRVLEHKYYFDEFYQRIITNSVLNLGNSLWTLVERLFIDGFINNLAEGVQRLAQSARHMQTGYVYHYAFSMVLGVVLMAAWFIYALW